MSPREIDRLVLRVLDLLGATEGRASYTAERLIRMGLFTTPAPSVADAAKRLGVVRKALASQMERNGLPAPRFLIMWGRLIRALDTYATGCSLEDAAYASGFPNMSVLSMAVTRHARMPARVWRERGADMDALILAFVRGRSRGEEAAA